MPAAVLDIDDPSAWEWRIAHDGRRIRVLRDGVSGVRVRTMVRDSVAGQIAADRQQVTDASGDSGLGLHKPGARFASDRAAYDAAEQAYLERVRDGENAWRAGPGGNQLDAALGEFAGAREGDHCTTNGEPGRMVRTASGELTCEPNQRRDSMLFESDAQASAYERRVRDGEAAWKTLGSL
jgi:hypothetical protein